MIKTELKSYQEKAVKEAPLSIKKSGGAALLFLPGQGKTITALSIIDSLLDSGEATIAFCIVPKSIIPTWISQIEKHTDFLDRYNKRGIYEFDSAKIRKDGAKEVPAGSIVFVRTETFQRNVKNVVAWVLRLVYSHKVVAFLDESHMIKNKSIRSTTIRSIRKFFSGVVIMTGTPRTTGINDVYYQWGFIRPNFFGISYTAFDIRYNVKREIRVDESGSIRKVNQNMADVKKLYALAEMNKGNLEKRRKFHNLAVVLEQEINEAEERIDEEVMPKIKEVSFFGPKKTGVPLEEVYYSEMNTEEGRAYREMKKNLITAALSGELVEVGKRSALMHKFRQITGGFVAPDQPVTGTPSKLELLGTLLENETGQAIIVSTYVSVAKMIADSIPGCALVFGQNKDNLKNIERFKSGEYKFLVATTSYIYQGIDGLQVAGAMYFWDVPLSYQHFSQVKARIDRLGQESDVRFIYLIAKDTFDQRCYDSLNAKQDLANRIFEISEEDFINAF